ncbi:MAG: hypothetical protein EAZ55_08985 [Cytophagales bacterium]|nr:MAG: hypothetical protein EAZ55_08985 [Cytophagales bacterium]
MLHTKYTTYLYKDIPLAYLLSFILFIFWGIYYLSEFLILTEAYYIRLDSAYLTLDKATEIAKKTKGFATMKLVFLFFIPLLYTSFTASCLFTAFSTIKSPINYQELFKISTIAYSIFFIPHIIKFLYFLSLSQDFTLTEYNNFIFGSFMPLYNPETDAYWIKALFESFTLFELLYWLMLVFGIQLHTGFDFEKSFKIVFLSYVLGLILFITIKIFFILTYFNI